jgi:uncharacterized protein (DUF58 family)
LRRSASTDRLERPRRLDGELEAAIALAVLAVIGALLGSLPLSVVGALGALGAVTLHVWQRWCLVGLRYRRCLSAGRADFGEEVVLEVEVVNDKLLPLTWLEVEDLVPANLQLLGATVVTYDALDSRMETVLALLPYQRVRRRIVVRCTERGPHRFGPASLRSGDPLGLEVRELAQPGHDELLVYPKRFAVDVGALASRALLGDSRTRWAPLEDPTRIVGVRAYRPGDPLRSIDWRASARSPGLQVRELESSASRSVALLVDYRIPNTLARREARSQLELVIAVAASLFCELAERRCAVGLWASGALDGAPLAFPCRHGPDQVPTVLEALARTPAMERVPFSAVLAAQVGTLRSGTSLVVVAADFPEPSVLALPQLRRRHHVSAVWVHGPVGQPPPQDVADVTYRVEHTDDWRDQDILDLAP